MLVVPRVAVGDGGALADASNLNDIKRRIKIRCMKVSYIFFPLSNSLSIHTYVCMYIDRYIAMVVLADARNLKEMTRRIKTNYIGKLHLFLSLSFSLYIHTYVYIYMCVCIYIYIYARRCQCSERDWEKNQVSYICIDVYVYV